MKKDSMHTRVVIEDATRKALKAKRLLFGYSYEQMAIHLGVHWSTYRKWERGETALYTRMMEVRVRTFLDDEELDDKVLFGASRDDVVILEKLIRRQRSLFRLISNDTRRRRLLINRIEATIDGVMDDVSRRTNKSNVDTAAESRAE